jgi:peptide chain release factor 2
LGKEKRELETVVNTLQTLEIGIKDGQELFEMAREENDDDTLKSVDTDSKALESRIEEMEFRRMFSGPLDANNCFIEFQSGSGGTEAQDWAQMLLRMYLRYCERKGFKVEVLEESEGDVAGIKGASIKVNGEYAFGTLRTENGVHRLVRKSPFDSNAKRHTSFASVQVFPEVDDSTLTLPIYESIPIAQVVLADNTSIKQIRRYALHIFPLVLLCNAKMTVLNIAIKMKQ